MATLTAASFASSSLGVGTADSAILYQRTAYNVINATASDAVNIGTLTTNSTQLDVTGQVTGQNSANYYKFTLQGNSLKLDLENLTDTTNAVDLRVKITDNSGKIIADNEGTSAQQSAYGEITSPSGLTANSGDYTATVTYAPTSVKSNPQSYSLSLYSGNRFDSVYETTAVAQTSASEEIPVDNTMTYATSDAQLYTTNAYHKIDETASTAVTIGWISENKGAL